MKIGSNERRKTLLGQVQLLVSAEMVDQKITPAEAKSVVAQFLEETVLPELGTTSTPSTSTKAADLSPLLDEIARLSKRHDPTSRATLTVLLRVKKQMEES